MPDLYSRSYNPIWNFRDLTGLPLDDTSWAYFLENDLPYAPQAVYQTPSGTVWNNPVQLSAAGTLENIFFDPDLEYRIEIRTNDGNLTPPSQSDPLVWLIENYVPDGGGSTPITTGTITTDNQITNPQFSIINFDSPLVLTAQPNLDLDIAPGWVLHLEGAGAGDVTVTRLPLTSSTTMPTNAPYALEFLLSGWTTAYLRQRFEKAGNLWASSATVDKYISVSLTARIEGAPQTLSAVIVNSDASLSETIFSTSLSQTYEEYSDNLRMPEPSNTSPVDSAYIDLQIHIPVAGQTSISSIQLVSTNNAASLSYEQDTIERQQDQTFHNYRESVLQQAKSSLLTGWDFPLNPWQFTTTTVTNFSGTGGYTADQTIFIPETTNSVQVGRSADPLGYFEIKSIMGNPQGKVAIIQYIDPATIAPYWDTTLSAMASMMIDTAGTELRVKMRLIHSTSLPATISATNPISGWSGDNPTFVAQWTEVEPENDPAYLVTGTLQDFAYNKFVLPAMTNTASTLGVVLYTTVDLSSAAADRFLIKSVSLVQNDFAVKPSPLTFDETLRQCQYYYEKSYEPAVLPGTVTQEGQESSIAIISLSGGGSASYRAPINLNYKTIKRADPTIAFYSPSTGTVAQVFQQIYETTPVGGSADDPISNYTQLAISKNSVLYRSNAPGSINTSGAVVSLQAVTEFHYTLDARLGI